jgi:hypothetical protein
VRSPSPSRLIGEFETELDLAARAPRHQEKGIDMNSFDAGHTGAQGSNGRRRAWRMAAPAAVLVALAFGVAACGGGPASSPSNAGFGSTTTTASSGAPGSSSPSSSDSTRMLEFARCMRAHGVTDFPDPSSPGSASQAGGNSYRGNSYNPNSPLVPAANQACAKYAAAQQVSSGEAAQVQAEQLQYAHCMRTHGVPEFPDPSSKRGFTIPKSIDQNSATFQSAQNACKNLQPQGPTGSGG